MYIVTLFLLYFFIIVVPLETKTTIDVCSWKNKCWWCVLFTLISCTSAECYSVLCPFLTKMSIIYRWNQHQMFYLQSSLDVAYHISMRIYKLFNLASLPKNDFTLVLYCSMSILNQWNTSIKKGLVIWLLRSHEHILLCHWFSTTIHQLSEDEETDSGEKQSTSIYIIKESSSYPRWVYLDNVCII